VNGPSVSFRNPTYHQQGTPLLGSPNSPSTPLSTLWHDQDPLAASYEGKSQITESITVSDVSLPTSECSDTELRGAKDVTSSDETDQGVNANDHLDSPPDVARHQDDVVSSCSDEIRKLLACDEEAGNDVVEKKRVNRCSRELQAKTSVATMSTALGADDDDDDDDVDDDGGEEELAFDPHEEDTWSVNDPPPHKFATDLWSPLSNILRRISASQRYKPRPVIAVRWQQVRLLPNGCRKGGKITEI